MRSSPQDRGLETGDPNLARPRLRLAGVGFRCRDRLLLRGAPEVHGRDPVHAADRAEGGAGLRRVELAADVLDGVLLERNRRVAPLLRAVVNEAELADVEIPGAGAAAPVVRLAVRQVVLEGADAGVEILDDVLRAVDPARDIVVDGALGRAE